MRAAIERDDQRRSGRARWGLAVAPAVAIVLVVLWLRRDHELILELPADPAPLADPSIAPTFYWVSSQQAPAPRAGVTYVDVDRTAPITQLDLR